MSSLNHEKPSMINYTFPSMANHYLFPIICLLIKQPRMKINHGESPSINHGETLSINHKHYLFNYLKKIHDESSSIQPGRHLRLRRPTPVTPTPGLRRRPGRGRWTKQCWSAPGGASGKN